MIAGSDREALWDVEDEELEVVLLNILEVLVRAVGDALTSGFVADDDAVLVHLKDGDGPHLGNGAFDGSLKCTRLVVAVAENEHFLGAHDGAYTYGEGGSGDAFGVATEEARVCHAGVGGQRLLTGAAGQRTARLVKGDVAVRTDTTNEEVDAAGFLNHLLVVGALGGQVFGVAVEQVDILFRAVDMVKQVLGHERVVALGVLFGQVDIFVHIEGDHVLEAYAAVLNSLNKRFVHADGRRTGGQTQHEGLLGRRLGGIDLVDYIVGSPLRQFLIIGLNNYSHWDKNLRVECLNAG